MRGIDGAFEEIIPFLFHEFIQGDGMEEETLGWVGQLGVNEGTGEKGRGVYRSVRIVVVVF